VETVVGCQVW